MRIYLAVTPIVVIACTADIQVTSASRELLVPADKRNIETLAVGSQKQKWDKFVLMVQKDNLLRALKNESSVYINILDCSDTTKKFPSIAFLGNIPLDEQHRLAVSALSSQPDVVAVRGYAPSSFVQGLSSTCVSLAGGNYSDSIRSRLVKVS